MGRIPHASRSSVRPIIGSRRSLHTALGPQPRFVIATLSSSVTGAEHSLYPGGAPTRRWRLRGLFPFPSSSAAPEHGHEDGLEAQTAY
jgi:hypothetical protein